MKIRLTAIFLLAIGGGAAAPVARPEDGQYLFLWAGDADKQQSDFLAVVDADPRSAAYASVVATVPVGVVGTRPHHTEHQMPAGGILWVNGFDSALTFRIDVRDPVHPRLLGSFGDVGAYSHPHSYARLPNGNVLATFQMWNHHESGGLVELDSVGRLVRATRASATAIDSTVRPYSLVVIPGIDRVVTTSSDMHAHQTVRSRAVQVWRLSDLSLLQTILLPEGPRGGGNLLTAEPRVLADGRTVLVNTFTCGLYRIDGLTGDSASATWLYSIPWQALPYCALPVVAGHFWIQANGPEHAVISLDVSNPRRPREVSRLMLAPDEAPHWIALAPDGDRIVITGYQALESRALVARVDRRTGALSLDSAFRTPGATRPGVDFSRETWPHGPTGRATPHGAVFSRQ